MDKIIVFFGHTLRHFLGFEGVGSLGGGGKKSLSRKIPILKASCVKVTGNGTRKINSSPFNVNIVISVNLKVIS